MKTEGFWRSSEDEQSDLPWPVPGEPSVELDKFLLKMASVERMAKKITFRGWSNCRLCGKPNGSVTYEYGGWAWPQGYAHYLRDHHVAPSDDFRAFIMSNG